MSRGAHQIVNIIDCNFFYERTLFHDYLFEFSDIKEVWNSVLHEGIPVIREITSLHIQEIGDFISNQLRMFLVVR